MTRFASILSSLFSAASILLLVLGFTALRGSATAAEPLTGGGGCGFIGTSCSGGSCAQFHYCKECTYWCNARTYCDCFPAICPDPC